MYQIISLILAAVGVVLFFAPEYILQKDSTNSTLKMIKEYHQVIGVALVGGAYYLYSYKGEKTVSEISTSSEIVETATTQSPSVPPSYEEATSEM